MIEAPRTRHRAVATHTAIGRLQPDNPVVGRGQPDGGAGVGFLTDNAGNDVNSVSSLTDGAFKAKEDDHMFS